MQKYKNIRVQRTFASANSPARPNFHLVHAGMPCAGGLLSACLLGEAEGVEDVAGSDRELEVSACLCGAGSHGYGQYCTFPSGFQSGGRYGVEVCLGIVNGFLSIRFHAEVAHPWSGVVRAGKHIGAAFCWNEDSAVLLLHYGGMPFHRCPVAVVVGAGCGRSRKCCQEQQ